MATSLKDCQSEGYKGFPKAMKMAIIQQNCPTNFHSADGIPFAQ